LIRAHETFDDLVRNQVDLKDSFFHAEVTA